MGSDIIRERMSKLTDANRDQVVESTKNEVLELLKQRIRPEFLNRIDEIIMFTPLTENEIKQIVKLQIDGVSRMLEKNGVHLEVTDRTLDFLAQEGYDPEFGARPVKRVIHKMILNQLSKDIIAQKVNRDKPIVIDYDGNKLVFKN